MRFLPYAQSFLHLIRHPEDFGETVITGSEEETELSNWNTPSRHLFFDIDDTLTPHRAGLNEELCSILDQWTRQEKEIHLVTNCSQGRAEQHRQRLRDFNCKANLWPHGLKPDYKWLCRELGTRGISPKECSFYGDRPTMDLWMAWKAGFAHRIWVKGWRQHSNRGSGLLRWSQDLEWKLLDKSSSENQDPS